MIKFNKTFRNLNFYSTKFSFETLDKKKFVQEKSEVNPEPRTKFEIKLDNAAEQRRQYKEKLPQIKLEQEIKESFENITGIFLKPKLLPEHEFAKKKILENYKKSTENYKKLSKMDQLLSNEYENEDDPEPELTEEEIQRSAENDLEKNHEFLRNNHKKIPGHLTKTSLVDKINGTTMEELFKTYKQLDDKLKLDVTEWKFGFENRQELATLQKESLSKIEKLNRVQFKNSKIYQKSKLIERKKDFYLNDVVSTIQFYKVIKELNFMDQDKYSKYRALYFSVVEFLKVSLKENEKYFEIQFEENNSQTESNLDSFLVDLSAEYNLKLEKEKKSEKDFDQREFEYFFSKVEDKTLDEKELNFYLMKKAFGTGNMSEIEKQLLFILNDLVEMFHANKILIFDVDLLESSRNFVKESHLSMFNELVEKNKKEIEAGNDQIILPKYVQSLRNIRKNNFIF
jgi:hypothetical protein